MKKFLGLGAAALAVPAAVISVAMMQPAVAVSEPSGQSSVNVVGEPYAKAIGILKQQGYKGSFGGSFGSDVPQSQCIVSQQKMTKQNRMILNLDCTQAAADDSADNSVSGGGGVPNGGPNVGSNGVTTVTPTPVGPQPGM